MASHVYLRLLTNCGLKARILKVDNLINRPHLATFWRSGSGTETTSKQDANTREGSEQSEGQSSAKVEEAAQPPAEDNKLAEENTKLQAALKEFQDKYKRSLAETENVRNRLRKQADDAKLFGIQGFCKDLLEVADTLDKAVESVSADVLSGGESNTSHTELMSLHRGVTMTREQLHKVFNKNGLYKIQPQEGDQFDPNVHEALFAHAVEGKPANTIMNVKDVGYKLHDRTIRPAMVGVFK